MVRLGLVARLLAVPLACAQLNLLARRAGKKYFGTATDTAELGNKAYHDILTDTREFGQLTPSNGQKWQFTEPEPHVFNFTEGSIVTDLARSTGQTLRCHNLVWHSQLAPWVESTTWTRATLAAALREHVAREAAHWRGRCYAWDVVNEALNEDGSLRDSVFHRVLGPDYLVIAFEAAARADPAARLYYNDYNIERPGPKQRGALDIVRMLRAAGARIDGVGLQGHFVAGEAPSADEIVAVMERFAGMGVEVALTELDVRVALPADAGGLARQREDYRNAVAACVRVERCVGITVWDFYDPFSWVPSVFPGYGDADLWFANFTKHPAYHGIVEALTQKTGYTIGDGSKGAIEDSSHVE